MVKVSIDRQERGITLQRERGRDFVWEAPGRWHVPSSPRSDGAVVQYTVKLEDSTGEFVCDCPDFLFRAARDKSFAADLAVEACKHIVAAEIEGAHRRSAVRRRRSRAERGAA